MWKRGTELPGVCRPRSIQCGTGRKPMPFAQPEADLVVAALSVGLGPGIRPVVGRVEFAEGAPVGQARVPGCRGCRSALLGAADEKMPPKLSFARPPKFSALSRSSISHAAAGFQQLQRGADAGNAAADDDYIAHSRPLRHFFRVYPETPKSLLAKACRNR
jgi:hypothetical protein